MKKKGKYRKPLSPKFTDYEFHLLFIPIWGKTPNKKSQIFENPGN